MNLKNVPIPQYYQLFHSFKSKIVQGEWPPGTQLPTVDQLCEEYGLSRATVIRGLDLLEQEGLLIRKRGKGNFVHTGAIKNVILRLKEIVWDWGENDIDVLHFEITKPSRKIYNSFLPQSVEKVLWVQRLIKKKGNVLYFSNAYINGEIGNKISIEDIKSQSVFKTIKNLEIKVKHVDRVIKPYICTQETSLHLGMSVGTPILRYEMKAYDLNDNLIYVVEMDSKIDGIIIRVNIDG